MPAMKTIEAPKEAGVRESVNHDRWGAQTQRYADEIGMAMP